MRNNQPVGVLLSMEFFQNLIASIEDSQDIINILKSKLEPEDGTPAEKLFSSLGIEI